MSSWPRCAVNKNLNDTKFISSETQWSKWLKIFLNENWLLQHATNKQKYMKEFDHESIRLIAIGGQGKIYVVRRRLERNNTKDDSKEFGEYIAFKLFELPRNNKKKETKLRERIFMDFMVVNELNLLTYGGLYYFKNEKIIMLEQFPLKYTLTNYVKNEAKIDEYKCKSVISEVLSIIWQLHKGKMVHCDLKPDNVMFGCFVNRKTQKEFLRWNVIDFGLVTSNDTKRDYIGTYQWTAPEIDVCSKKNTFSYAVDIWAIGLILLYMLLKTHPYLLTKNEKEITCKNDKYLMKKYFYYHKLLRNNSGQRYLNDYLRQLYLNGKISAMLFDLLLNNILIFDPAKRSNCKQIYSHSWFDDIR